MSCLYSYDKAHRSRRINPIVRGVCSHLPAAWPQVFNQEVARPTTDRPKGPKGMDATTAPGILVARRTRAVVARLAIAQALTGANSAVIFATGSIIGSMLAPNPSLATLPLSIFVLGMASGTLPVGFVARRYGRRAALIAGPPSGGGWGKTAV